MEIELKFALPSARVMNHFRDADALCGFALGQARVKRVRDTYLDAPGRPLLAAGWSLRERAAAREVTYTLKGLGGAEGATHRREEIELVVPEPLPLAAWPESPLKDRVLACVPEASLAPLFVLAQRRIVRAVRAADRVVAEMSLDAVRVSAGSRCRSYYEMEIELAPEGTEEDLSRLAACLQAEQGLQPQPASKFERALALADRLPVPGFLDERARACLREAASGSALERRRALALLALDRGADAAAAGKEAGLTPHRVRYWLRAFQRRGLAVLGHTTAAAPASADAVAEALSVAPPVAVPCPTGPGLTLTDTLDEAARKTLLFHWQRMMCHEAGTRLGEDIEELHDMRVAVRRMRAALQVFAEYIDSEEVGPLGRGLRRLGRTLGAVRDLDVFQETVQAYIQSLPPERQDELTPLLAQWALRRQEARGEMLLYLDSERFALLKQRGEELLRREGSLARPAFDERGQPLPRDLRDGVPVLVHRGLAAVRAYGPHVAVPEVPLERLHSLRIASKGLRYTLEFFQEILGPETKAAIQRIKGLQDHLGELQDAVVACTLLRDFLIWGTWGEPVGAPQQHPAEPIIAPGVASYLAVRQADLQRLVAGFPKVWQTVSGPEFSSLVLAALAPLT